MAIPALAQEVDPLAELIKDFFGLQGAVIATIQTAMAGAIIAVTNFLKTLFNVNNWTAETLSKSMLLKVEPGETNEYKTYFVRSM